MLAFTVMVEATEVVVNKDTQVTSMTVEEVRAIFTLRKSYWSNGVKVKVFILPKSSIITKKFAYDTLQMPVNMYFDILESGYSRGKSNIPVVLDNEYSMLLNLSLNSGSVGYIYSADIVIDAPNVKVIKIQQEGR
jgi:ABC-type phosphate transport system substrate-binding protein